MVYERMTVGLITSISLALVEIWIAWAAYIRYVAGILPEGVQITFGACSAATVGITLIGGVTLSAIWDESATREAKAVA